MQRLCETQDRRDKSRKSMVRYLNADLVNHSSPMVTDRSISIERSSGKKSRMRNSGEATGDLNRNCKMPGEPEMLDACFNSCYLAYPLGLGGGLLTACRRVA
jgi:hypothetical protein